MRLCTCGHRDARHEAWGCLVCSCGVFEDAKSLIEEEVGTGQIIDVAETPVLRQLREAFQFAPIVTDEEIAAHLAAGNDIVRVVRPESVGPIVHIEAPELPPEDPDDHETFAGRALQDPEVRRGYREAAYRRGVEAGRDSLLESYDAWRCPDCCCRWFTNRRCCGVKLQPIRVEIHTREVD